MNRRTKGLAAKDEVLINGKPDLNEENPFRRRERPARRGPCPSPPWHDKDPRSRPGMTVGVEMPDHVGHDNMVKILREAQDDKKRCPITSGMTMLVV